MQLMEWEKRTRSTSTLDFFSSRIMRRLEESTEVTQKSTELEATSSPPSVRYFAFDTLFVFVLLSQLN